MVGPDGLLSQLTGDVAVEATSQTGTIPVGGVLMAGTHDPAATASWLGDTLTKLPIGGSSVKPTADGGYRIVRRPVGWSTERRGDVTITYVASGSELPIAYAVIGDVAVVGTSLEQVERVVDTHGTGSSISSSPRFTSATASVPTDDGILYLDVPAIVQAVRGQLPPEEAASFDTELGKALKPIEAVVAGTKNEPDLQRTRLFVRIP